MNSVFSPVQQLLITWLLVLVTGWFTLTAISYVGELVSILVTAGLIAFLLNYAVARLQVFLPRGVAAALVYLVAGVVVVVIGLTIVPPVFTQARQLGVRFPDLLESARQQLGEFQTWSADRNLPFDVQILEQQLSAKVQEQVQAIAGTSLGLVVGTVNWFLDLIFILVISFYMLLDGKRVWQGLTSIFSPDIRYVLTETLQRNLQRFVSGQLLLGLFMATSLTLAFSWLQVPFFLLFAVFIGLMEIIPFIGATLGIGAVSIIVAFIDWWLALQVLAVAIGLQQIKDNLVAPRIMGNLTGLSPVIIFTALLLGGRVGGLLGVILAIPLTGVVKSIVEILLNPKLPPQTGSFFYNPFNGEELSQITDNETKIILVADEKK
ncbi:MAG: AI-2E family transporter [Microcoleus sp.]